MSAPRASHTRYGERRARLQSPEDWHRIGDHDEHFHAGCELCLRWYRIEFHDHLRVD